MQRNPPPPTHTHHHRNSKMLITLPFFIEMDRNLAWLSRWYRPSLEPKKRFKLWLVASITYYVCQYVFPIYLGHFSSEWTEILHDEVIYNIRHFPLRKIPPWKFPRTLPLAASPCIWNTRFLKEEGGEKKRPYRYAFYALWISLWNWSSSLVYIQLQP